MFGVAVEAILSFDAERLAREEVISFSIHVVGDVTGIIGWIF